LVRKRNRFYAFSIFLWLYFNTSNCNLKKIVFLMNLIFFLKFPGGWIALKIGGKNTATLTILFGSVLTLLV
jgi:hypothetical protein